MEVSSFISQFVAFVKGDDAEAQAIRAKRAAESALKAHIYAMEGDILKLEDDVERYNEKLKDALINKGEKIEDRDQYVRNLVDAKNLAVVAEEKLAAHKETLEFLKEQLAGL
jgi:hypothetical protein